MEQRKRKCYACNYFDFSDIYLVGNPDFIWTEKTSSPGWSLGEWIIWISRLRFNSLSLFNKSRITETIIEKLVLCGTFALSVSGTRSAVIIFSTEEITILECLMLYIDVIKRLLHRLITLLSLYIAPKQLWSELEWVHHGLHDVSISPIICLILIHLAQIAQASLFCNRWVWYPI